MKTSQTYCPKLLKYVIAAICFCLLTPHAMAQDLCKTCSVAPFTFTPRSTKLTKLAKQSLDSAIRLLKTNHGCSVFVRFCAHEHFKDDKIFLIDEERRVAVLKYFTSNGVDETRINETDYLGGNDTFFLSIKSPLVFDPLFHHPNFRTGGAKTAMALPDSDGDCIPNQLDLEPNTPPGAAVDTHGRALDTDGDGVPDYKDKEKLTQQKCFPVDSNGVGVCPNINFQPPKTDSVTICNFDSCNNKVNVTVKLEGFDNFKLSPTIIKLLDSAVLMIPNYSLCNIKIVGYESTASDYHEQQYSWDRVYVVLRYLLKRGVNKQRLIFSYDNAGMPGVIDIFSTSEIGPYFVPPPHVKYTKLKNVNWDTVFKESYEQIQNHR